MIQLNAIASATIISLFCYPVFATEPQPDGHFKAAVGSSSENLALSGSLNSGLRPEAESSEYRIQGMPNHPWFKFRTLSINAGSTGVVSIWFKDEEKAKAPHFCHWFDESPDKKSGEETFRHWDEYHKIYDILGPILKEKRGVFKRVDKNYRNLFRDGYYPRPGETVPVNYDLFYESVCPDKICEFLEILYYQQLIDDYIVDLVEAQLALVGFALQDFRVCPEKFADLIAQQARKVSDFVALKSIIMADLERYMLYRPYGRQNTLWAVIEALQEGLAEQADNEQEYGPKDLIIELCEMIDNKDFPRYVKARKIIADLKRSQGKDDPKSTQLAYIERLLPIASHAQTEINDAVKFLYNGDDRARKELPEELRNLDGTAASTMRLLRFLFK